MPHCEQCGAPLPEDNSPCACNEANKDPAPLVAEHSDQSRHRRLLRAAIPLILLVGVAVFLVILFSTGSRRITPVSYPLFREELVPVAREIQNADGTTSVKWGYANKQGQMVIEAKFEMAREFSKSGLAPIKQTRCGATSIRRAILSLPYNLRMQSPSRRTDLHLLSQAARGATSTKAVRFSSIRNLTARIPLPRTVLHWFPSAANTATSTRRAYM